MMQANVEHRREPPYLLPDHPIAIIGWRHILQLFKLGGKVISVLEADLLSDFVHAFLRFAAAAAWPLRYAAITDIR